MNLRKITFFAGVTQLLALVGSTINYVLLLGKLHWDGNAQYLIMQPIWLLSQAILTLFFFILFAELKKD